MAAIDASVVSQRWMTLTPLLYDWLATTTRTWPSLACRWGPPSSASAAGSDPSRSRQRLYFSEQTDGTAPNTLIASFVDVVKPRHADASTVARAWERQAGAGSAFRKGKTVYHTGEVNKIREVQGIPASTECVVTHSDVPVVYLWRLSSQPDRHGDGNTKASTPDAVLAGHTAPARFALATSASSACVASGGEDTAVCLWRLADLDNSLFGAGAQGDAGRTSLNSGGLGGLASTSAPAQLQASCRFEGHSQTVEDVSFNPSRDTHLCSVGDDSALCLWDSATGTRPVLKLDNAHGTSDVHTVDWSRHDDRLLITGGADNCVRLFDLRKASSHGSASMAQVHVFSGHAEAINVVQWCPDAPGVFASAGSDGLVNIWDVSRALAAAPPSSASRKPTTALIFQHPGHAGSPVLDFHWSPAEPWTCVSVSENAEAGGSTVQVWRISDMLYRPEHEVLAELEQHKATIAASMKRGKQARNEDDDDDARVEE